MGHGTLDLQIIAIRVPTVGEVLCENLIICYLKYRVLYPYYYSEHPKWGTHIRLSFLSIQKQGKMIICLKRDLGSSVEWTTSNINIIQIFNNKITGDARTGAKLETYIPPPDYQNGHNG
jgi:hypothetical protein